MLLPLPVLHLLVATIVAVCCASTLQSRASVAVWSFVCAVASAVIGMALLPWAAAVDINPYYVAVYQLQGLVFALVAPVIALVVHALVFRHNASDQPR